MTVKEKAKELVRHFKGRGMDGDENYASKECALIVVEEIIDVIQFMAESDEPGKLPFWQEVKTEIEKL